MRRILPFSLCALLLGVGALAVFCFPGRMEARVLRELEEHSDVPIPLTAPEQGLPELPGAARTEGWGCYQLENEDLSLTLSGWPDVQDPYHVTQWTLRSPRYALFGLRTGCALDDVEAILGRYHYRPVSDPVQADGSRPLNYEKGPVSIGFDLTPDLARIAHFYVSVAVSNRENVVF